MDYLGELAALGTATCWSFGAIMFGIASTRVGPFIVNCFRIPLAAAILVVASLIAGGQILPADVQTSQVFWLTASGIIGLVLGDYCYFKSLVLCGPRLASLLMVSAPIFALVISWIVLSQAVGILGLLGIVITIGGIGWVVLERSVQVDCSRKGSRGLGILMGTLGGLGQAVGLVLAKIGMGENFSALNATLVRMVAASIAIWLAVLASAKVKTVLRGLRDRKAVAAMSGAAFVGPFLGIWLSLISIQYTKVGIASTLMATSPILVIPLVIFIYGEKPSARAVFGTFVAITGVALIFLR